MCRFVGVFQFLTNWPIIHQIIIKVIDLRLLLVIINTPLLLLLSSIDVSVLTHDLSAIVLKCVTLFFNGWYFPHPLVRNVTEIPPTIENVSKHLQNIQNGTAGSHSSESFVTKMDQLSEMICL